jgi:hypothetical protein
MKKSTMMMLQDNQPEEPLFLEDKDYQKYKQVSKKSIYKIRIFGKSVKLFLEPLTKKQNC